MANCRNKDILTIFDPTILLDLWENRTQILSDKQKCSEELPGVTSGGSICGQIYFPIGAMLRCWEECPAFQQISAEGHKCFIFQWSGSGLSGLCHVHYIDISEGAIHKAQYHAIDGNHTFSAITRAALPYVQTYHLKTT